ncbi:malonyl-ACP O-methyltransferase BioC [Buchnera aphidicola]|nr:malonyl-ACP O-methyltransferase BioC [Buchnera aphidicola]
MNYITNKRKIEYAFNRAAKNYDFNSTLQKVSGNILLSKTKLQFNISILDAGCGTGWFSKKWKQYGNKVTALDLSRNMILYAKQSKVADYYLQADIEALPINNNIFDLCWSNLSLQWCHNLSKGISELCRVTKPGGIILFSTIADGSLSELKQAWSAIDSHCHVNDFLTIQEISSVCQKKNTIIDSVWITLSFSKVLEAMMSIKKVGANYVNRTTNKIVTKKKIEILKQSWPRNKNGYSLTYKLVFGVIYL